MVGTLPGSHTLADDGIFVETGFSGFGASRDTCDAVGYFKKRPDTTVGGWYQCFA